jgi:hypothetical protein
VDDASAAAADDASSATAAGATSDAAASPEVFKWTNDVLRKGLEHLRHHEKVSYVDFGIAVCEGFKGVRPSRASVTRYLANLKSCAHEVYLIGHQANFKYSAVCDTDAQYARDPAVADEINTKSKAAFAIVGANFCPDKSFVKALAEVGMHLQGNADKKTADDEKEAFRKRIKAEEAQTVLKAAVGEQSATDLPDWNDVAVWGDDDYGDGHNVPSSADRMSSTSLSCANGATAMTPARPKVRVKSHTFEEAKNAHAQLTTAVSQVAENFNVVANHVSKGLEAIGPQMGAKFDAIANFANKALEMFSAAHAPPRSPMVNCTSCGFAMKTACFFCSRCTSRQAIKCAVCSEVTRFTPSGPLLCCGYCGTPFTS